MGYFHAQNYTSGTLLDISTIVLHLVNNTTQVVPDDYYSFKVTVEQLRNSQVLKTNTLISNWFGTIIGNSRNETFTLSQKMSFNIQTDSLWFSFRTVNPYTPEPFHVYIDYDDNVNFNLLTEDYRANYVDTYSEDFTITIPVDLYYENQKDPKIGVTCLIGDRYPSI